MYTSGSRRGIALIIGNVRSQKSHVSMPSSTSLVSSKARNVRHPAHSGHLSTSRAFLFTSAVILAVIKKGGDHGRLIPWASRGGFNADAPSSTAIAHDPKFAYRLDYLSLIHGNISHNSTRTESCTAPVAPALRTTMPESQEWDNGDDERNAILQTQSAKTLHQEESGFQYALVQIPLAKQSQ